MSSMPSVPSVPSDFIGAIPEFYERHLVPVIFDPYAEDLVGRIAAREGLSLLEVASGTGVVTRRLLSGLPTSARITATDLNEAMIQVARARTPADPRLEWRAADGTALPFADASFDVVLCQFGVMFFPDKDAGFREARRVLKPGGRYLFNVWDSFEHNAFGRIARETIASFFASDPPQFYLTPFGYHDAAVIEQGLGQAGFRSVRIERVAKEARSATALDFATGLVRGNPVALSIAERGLDAVAIAETVAAELAREYGDRPMHGPMRALVVEAEA
ncbi:MAG: methyltransferase domain-containing protein [Candidatus Eisenbacteria bacterium]